MRKMFALAAVLSVFAATACAEANGEDGGGAVGISSARWSAEGGEARAVVYGRWVRGLSTPPKCSLLESRDGESSEWPASENNTSPEGNSFYKEFTADGETSRLDPTLDYHVRCSVNVATGRTLDAQARIEGEVPDQYRPTAESTSE